MLAPGESMQISLYGAGPTRLRVAAGTALAHTMASERFGPR